MKTTKELIEPSVFNLHIELPPERVEEAKKALTKEYRQLIEAPGFRKGKVPMAIIEKKFSKNFQEDLEKTLIDSDLEKAIEEQELDLFLDPEITEAHFQEDGSFHFIANCVTRPEIRLPDFSQLEVCVVEKDIVTKADINEELERLRRKSEDYLTIENRGLKMGDIAVIEYVGKIDEESLKEVDDVADLLSYLRRDEYCFRMEKNFFFPGLEQALLGLKPGETRECKITISQDYWRESLADVEVTYTIKLHEIKLPQPPPLNDDFAAMASEQTTLKALREEIRDDIQACYDEEFDNNVYYTIINELVSKIPCELPAAALSAPPPWNAQALIEDYRSYGILGRELLNQKKLLKISSEEITKKALHLDLILKAVIAREKIEATAKELRDHIDSLLDEGVFTVKGFEKEMKNNKDLLKEIREKVIYNKALRWITSQMKIRTRPSEDKKSNVLERAVNFLTHLKS